MTVTKTDVLIIGAGPAGLMTAACLTRMHANITVVDRRLPEEYFGQADGIQSRTIEIWDSLGLGDELRRVGTHVHRMVLYNSNKEGTGIMQTGQAQNVTAPTMKYPFEVLAPIDMTEGILRRDLAQRGVTVKQPTIPVHLSRIGPDSDEDKTYPVKVRLLHLDADKIRESGLRQDARMASSDISEYVNAAETVYAKYVVGCDGGRSWVRKSQSIQMEGDRTALSWGVIDFTPITDFPTARAKNIIKSPVAGLLGWLPRPQNSARVYVLLGEAAPANGSEITPASAASTAEGKAIIFKAVKAGFLPYNIDLTDVTWFSVYTVSQCVAKAFSSANRVFLVGDACHTISPKGGQGANLAMAEAYNLAWKIGYNLRGWGHPELLTTYSEERRPIALNILDFDKEVFKLFDPSKSTPEEYASLWHRQNMLTTGIGLKYSSALSRSKFQDLATDIHIGERLPPSTIIRHCDWNPQDLLALTTFDGTHKLIILPGNATQEGTSGLLSSFADFLSSGIAKDDGEAVIQTAVVFNNDREACLTDVLPLSQIYSPDRVFVVDPADNLYTKFSVAVAGATILVRPDAHVALLAPLTKVGVKHLADYLYSL